MEQRDYETYVNLFRNLSNFMCRPNAIVYLDVTPENSLKRIQQRDRGCESGITLEYLSLLYKNYEEFVQDISKLIPVIRVGWNEFWKTEEIAAAITREYTRTSFLRQISK
jgi:deoxyadenosine kinase